MKTPHHALTSSILSISSLFLLLLQVVSPVTIIAALLSPPSNPTRDQAAAILLESLPDRLVTPFTTNVTEVLELGFPHPFEPCVLPRILERKARRNEVLFDYVTPSPATTLNVLVLGGSSAARPGNGCSNTESDPFAGRYSNILESQLNQGWQSSSEDTPLIQFQVSNMAQGSEVSAEGAMFLDATVDVHHTDVIVWDYSINDSTIAGSQEEEVRKLDFWLTRLSRLYEPYNRPPPPVVLLYLWVHRAGAHLSKGKIDNLDKHPMSYLTPLLEAYREEGWDIAVVNVGAAVDSTILQQNTRLFFDDSLHQGCAGNHFIADMLEYVLLSNLALDCPTHMSGSRNDQMPSLPEHQEQLWPNTGTTLEDLWVDLFNPDAVIGSWSAWTPRIPGQSNLNVQLESTMAVNSTTNNNTTPEWPLEVIQVHTASTRQDRKFGYRLPRCDNDQAPLVTTLVEPNLAWLGLALRGNYAAIHLQINNITVDLQDWGVDKWNYGQNLLTHWIYMGHNSTTTNATTSSYQLTFCQESALTDDEIRNRTNGELPNLQYLVGVCL